MAASGTPFPSLIQHGIMTRDEAADFLGIPRRFAATGQARSGGYLPEPFGQINGRSVYRVSDVEAFAGRGTPSTKPVPATPAGTVRRDAYQRRLATSRRLAYLERLRGGPLPVGRGGLSSRMVRGLIDDGLVEDVGFNRRAQRLVGLSRAGRRAVKAAT